MDIEQINSITDISAGHLPGYFFKKLIDLGQLIISPFDEKSLGNICYYLHLNNVFRKYKQKTGIIDTFDKDSIEAAFTDYEVYDEIILMPGESLIGQTYEEIYLSEWLLAKLENTSSLGRVFVNHASHGFSHPGHGKESPVRLMLEFTNLGSVPVKIYPAYYNDKGELIGTQIMRIYIEKLPYMAEDYKSISNVHKLRMTDKDNS